MYISYICLSINHTELEFYKQKNIYLIQFCYIIALNSLRILTMYKFHYYTKIIVFKWRIKNKL